MKRPRLSERFRRPPRFLRIDNYLRPQDQPIGGSPQSREARLVPLVVIDYGSLAARLRQMRFIGRYLFKALSEMIVSARSIRDNPYAGKQRLETETRVELEAYARSLGITSIGYTRVNPRYIFNGFQILFPHAIVFTMEMDREKIRQAPAIPSFIEIFRTYTQLGVIVNQIAGFLRQRGYNAQAGPAIGGDVNYIPLAIDAGLGAVGKNGLLVSPANGPRLRLAAVYTDIENLPFAEANPHAWVRDYCESCNNCVDKCPAGAIYRETKQHPQGGPVFIDHTLCADPFSNDNGCTLCIKYCPFSYGDYEQIKARFEGRVVEGSIEPVR